MRPPMVPLKPRLRFMWHPAIGRSVWVCISAVPAALGVGSTPKQAYHSWDHQLTNVQLNLRRPRVPA